MCDGYIMANAIIITIATCVIIYGLVDLVFNLSGINKKHNMMIERLNISFISMMEESNKLMSTLSITGMEPSVVTYFVPCWPGIYNKLRGNIKLYLYTHQYNVTEAKVDKSRQLLVVSKEQFFFMQLKGWVGTTDKKKAVKAIRYLKEMVSLP